MSNQINRQDLESLAAMRIAELQRAYSRHNSTTDFSFEDKLFWALAQVNKSLMEENRFMSVALNPNEGMAKLAEEHEAKRLEAEERYRLLADELQKRGCPSRVPAEIIAWIDQGKRADDVLDQALAIAHRIGVPPGTANFLAWLSAFADTLETESGTDGDETIALVLDGEDSDIIYMQENLYGRL